MASAGVSAAAYAAAGDKKQALIAAATIAAAGVGAGGAMVAFKVAKTTVNAGRVAKLVKEASNTKAIASNFSRKLADGRIRSYGEFKAARTSGEMAGARKVREIHPSGRVRSWYETLDHSGKVRQVRPFDGAGYRHYKFDKKGRYAGRW